MTDARGLSGQRRSSKRPGPTVRLSPAWQLTESHLLPDAVVAFVDGELSLGAQERAATHLMRCPSCAADVEAQRSVRAAVHACHAPSVPAGLLASLQSIPDTTELSTTPDNLAVDANGQLVAVQRHTSRRPPPTNPAQGPDRVDASFGSRAPFGSSAPLGSNGLSRRAVQGAGVVMSGLVLSALALALSVEDDREPSPRQSSGFQQMGVPQP